MSKAERGHLQLNRPQKVEVGFVIWPGKVRHVGVYAAAQLELPASSQA